MSKNVPLKACKNIPKSAYSSAMSIALQNRTPELDALLERFRERRELVPFKARGLKGLAAELGAAFGIGFPGKRFGGRWQNADTREAIDSSGGWLCGSQNIRFESLKSVRTSRPCRGERSSSTKGP